MCDCGEELTAKSRELGAGDVKSCGCLRKEVSGDLLRTHGWAGTKEYLAWKKIKARCNNPNDKCYPKYSKIGMSSEFSSNFLAFLDEIGEIPEDLTGRVSVDRIDNNLGYVAGNIRWANDEMQARNKGSYSNNKSGINGVYRMPKYWVANWYESQNKQRQKYFPIKKHGEELAFFMACEFREQMIALLNLAGAGYTENHGKPKEVNNNG